MLEVTSRLEAISIQFLMLLGTKSLVRARLQGSSPPLPLGRRGELR